MDSALCLQTQRFNNYVTDLSAFESTVRRNMNMEGVDAADRLQDYQHKIIQELIEREKYKDIQTFLAFSKMLSLVYNSYLKMYKHASKESFNSLNASANVFRNTIAFNNAEQKKVDDYIHCLVLCSVAGGDALMGLCCWWSRGLKKSFVLLSGCLKTRYRIQGFAE